MGLDVKQYQKCRRCGRKYFIDVRTSYMQYDKEMVTYPRIHCLHCKATYDTDYNTSVREPKVRHIQRSSRSNLSCGVGNKEPMGMKGWA